MKIRLEEAYIIEIYAFFGVRMKRVCGLGLFCFAMGMLFMLIVSSEILGFFLIVLFLMLGYHMYCC